MPAIPLFGSDLAHPLCVFGNQTFPDGSYSFMICRAAGQHSLRLFLSRSARAYFYILDGQKDGVEGGELGWLETDDGRQVHPHYLHCSALHQLVFIGSRQ